jgi:hypothetical protein
VTLPAHQVRLVEVDAAIALDQRSERRSTTRPAHCCVTFARDAWGSKNEVTKNPWRGMSDILRMASGTSDNPL